MVDTLSTLTDDIQPLPPSVNAPHSKIQKPPVDEAPKKVHVHWLSFSLFGVLSIWRFFAVRVERGSLNRLWRNLQKNNGCLRPRLHKYDPFLLWTSFLLRLFITSSYVSISRCMNKCIWQRTKTQTGVCTPTFSLHQPHLRLYPPLRGGRRLQPRRPR